ncbi:hypothetical protein BaRGS_00018684, partial [Batillaria attramentaria]
RRISLFGKYSGAIFNDLVIILSFPPSHLCPLGAPRNCKSDTSVVHTVVSSIPLLLCPLPCVLSSLIATSYRCIGLPVCVLSECGSHRSVQHPPPAVPPALRPVLTYRDQLPMHRAACLRVSVVHTVVSSIPLLLCPLPCVLSSLIATSYRCIGLPVCVLSECGSHRSVQHPPPAVPPALRPVLTYRDQLPMHRAACLRVSVVHTVVSSIPLLLCPLPCVLSSLIATSYRCIGLPVCVLSECGSHRSVQHPPPAVPPALRPVLTYRDQLPMHRAACLRVVRVWFTP